MPRGTLKDAQDAMKARLPRGTTQPGTLADAQSIMKSSIQRQATRADALGAIHPAAAGLPAAQRILGGQPGGFGDRVTLPKPSPNPIGGRVKPLPPVIPAPPKVNRWGMKKGGAVTPGMKKAPKAGPKKNTKPKY